jgi:hypothetical protein
MPTFMGKATVWSLALLCVAGLVLAGRRRIRSFNDHRSLRHIAQTISGATGCRYVVFGHSHDPDAYPLSPSGDQWYFNVGTWVPRGHDGQFVYLQLMKEQWDYAVHLMRWDGGRQQPAEVNLASYRQGSAERKAMLREVDAGPTGA